MKRTAVFKLKPLSKLSNGIREFLRDLAAVRDVSKSLKKFDVLQQKKKVN